MINIDCCLFVLKNIKNENKKKNDSKELQLVLTKNNDLISTKLNKNENIKDSIRNKVVSIIENNKFHLEQVYTLGDAKYHESGIHIIYLGIINEENIKKLDSNYKLVDFDIIDNSIIKLANNLIKYKTTFKENNNSLEYYHEIETNDIKLERTVIEILTSYKYIISRIDYTDIMFKFLPKYYTLEDVRIVYEKIKGTKVDKSNFRKRIIKYCKRTNKIVNDKGYRPTQLYEFVLDKKDIWL